MAKIGYLVRDLLFTSKIRETCRQLGLDVAPATTAAALGQADAIIVDLRIPEALGVLGDLEGQPGARAQVRIGFVDHERKDVMDAARARGCTHVLTKGQLSSDLARLLEPVAPR